MQKSKVHYGWVIVATGSAVLFACLGLGRFSLGMLLPSMGISLTLSYSQMGLIGTGNFVGYMISVILAGIIAKSIGARWTIALGLVLVGGSMMLISRATGFMGVMVLYVATGIGSGLANVPNLFLYISIGIFGLAVWSIPTIMSAAVGDYTGPARAVKAFGFITVFFGIGQITGPAVAGYLADLTGSFSMAFWLCAVLTGLAIVLTKFLRPPTDFCTGNLR